MPCHVTETALHPAMETWDVVANTLVPTSANGWMDVLYIA